MSWKLVETSANGEVNKYKNSETQKECWITGTRKLEIPVGLPPGIEPEVTEADLSEKELNKQFLLSRRKCFVCSSTQNIGIAICLKPCDITEEEKEQQSKHDKMLNTLRVTANEKLTSVSAASAAATPEPASAPEQKDEIASTPAAEVVAPVLSSGQQGAVQLKTKYTPYPKCLKATQSVKSIEGMIPSRLIPELIPVFVCVHCRRMGESGSQNENSQCHPCFPKVQIPPPKERNIINKYMQANACIMRYMDEKGKVYPITDRLLIITNADAITKNLNNCENILFQQFELILDPSSCKTLEKIKGRPEFIEKLTFVLCKIIPSLLRAAARLSTKVTGEEELRDMNDFEKTYEFSLVIIRAALHCISTYPDVANKLKALVLKWTYNPFSQDNKKYFQHWMDVLWISSLVGLPFSFIRHSLIRCLFNEISLNYPQPVGDDKKLYLKRLFNEGRSRNTSRQLLYTMAFTGMISEHITKTGVKGFISMLDDHECYLPEECLKVVWREMQHVNRMVVSLEPCTTEQGEYLPGLFKHMGMGDPMADNDTTVEHIFKFFDYVKSTSQKLTNLSIPDNILANINIDLLTQMSSVARHTTLKLDEDKRREQLKTIHKGSPLVINGKEARLTTCKCLYSGCGRQFTSEGKLKKHLAEAWNTAQDSVKFNKAEIHRYAFGQGSEFDGQYHPWQSVTKIKDAKVLDGTITIVQGESYKCPVDHCTKTFTDLVAFKDHLAQYGVKPYLYPGWVDSKIVVSKQEEKTEKIGSLWENPGTCVICMDSNCEEILLPCGHVCMCTECRTDWGKRNTTCPTCRTQISKILPIAAYTDKSEIKVFKQ